jgi:hypothetical protein
MGPTALLPLRRKACWGFFFRPKNPTASAWCEPVNLGTKGQHATSRPPKPLIYMFFSYNKPTRCTNFSNLFWKETLHVSDSSSVHHPEFFTVLTAMVYVIRFFWQLACCQKNSCQAVWFAAPHFQNRRIERSLEKVTTGFPTQWCLYIIQHCITLQGECYVQYYQYPYLETLQNITL